MKRKAATGAVAGVALASIIGVGVAGAATGKGPAGPLGDALSSLVSNGTITQDQADKVAEAVSKSREQARADRRDRVDARQAEVDKILNDVLGLTRDQVKQKLTDGQTVGEVVGDKGDELASALHGLLQERLDQAVANGRLTQEKADRLAEQSKKRLSAAFTPGSPLMEAKGMAGLAMLARQQFGMGFHGQGKGHRWGHPHGKKSSEPSASATASTAATA